MFCFVFTISIATATFIEEYYDTLTAKLIVYNARWFELLLLLLVINFIGHIKEYQMLSRKKWAGLTFHSAFILMIIGAGITRYTGYEGSMRIREGSTSNILYTSDPNLSIMIGNDKETEVDIPVYLTNNFQKSFELSVEDKDGSEIEISYKDFIKNAEESVVEYLEDGFDIFEIQVQ